MALQEIGQCKRQSKTVHELLLSNDLVRLSFLRVLLRDFGIETVVLDREMSALEGSGLAIPCRLIVADEDVKRARRVLREAGEGAER